MKKMIIILVILTVLIGADLLFLNTINEDNNQIPLEEIEVSDVKQETIIEENVVDEYLDVDLDTYHSKLVEIAEKSNVYGMSVVVFKGEEILDSFNYGYSDVENKVEVTDSTCFRIASTSKMISNMLIMKLVDEGFITLDSELNKVTDLHYQDGVKLYHILTHTSGLTDSSEYNNNMDKVFDINYLLEISAVNVPGKVYNYSNFESGTMSAIVEKLTNERFYDYAQKNLFDYLDLNASYVVEYLDEGTDVAKLYSDTIIDPKNWFYNKDFYDQFEIGNQYRLAHGSLYISGSDLAKLGMVLAGNGMLNDKSVLSYNALQEIRTIRNEAIDHKYIMGLNTDLFLDYVKDRRIYGHTGSAYGAITCLMYDPSDNTGVAIVSNHASQKQDDEGYNYFLHSTVAEAYKDFFTLK